MIERKHAPYWVAAVIVAVLIVVGTRHHVVRAPGDSPIIYLINRWTGTVQFCVPAGCREIRQIEQQEK